MRTHRFSKFPWRYERCIINSLDLDIEVDLPAFKPNKPKIIHRVVVNNRTLSIFENFNYDTVMFSSGLKETVIEMDGLDPSCCKITNSITKESQKACAPGMYQGDPTQLIKQFIERVKFFRDSCYQKLPIKTDFSKVAGKES